MVIDAETQDPIADASVRIENDAFSYAVMTDGGGTFAIASFYEGSYDVFAGKWSYKTAIEESTSIDVGNNSVVMELSVGYEDIFSVDLGWEVDGQAAQGHWERGVPLGWQPAGAPINLTPPEDVIQDIGNHCYVTGNAPELDGLLAGGNSLLTSPSMDLTTYDDPYLSYHTWFFNFNVNIEAPGTYEMYVLLSNGGETITVDTLTYPELDDVTWVFGQVRVSDYFTPGDDITVAFNATSSLGFNEVTEAGLDFFQVSEGPVEVGVFEGIAEVITLNAFPNPSTGSFVVNYNLEYLVPGTTVNVYNVSGQLVESVNIRNSQGTVQLGSDWDAGLYILKLNNSPNHSGLRLVKQ
jgi:hypothetical protein